MTGNGREGGCRAAQRHREDFLGGFEEGLCVVQEGKAPRGGAEVACSDTCFHGHVGQGTGGVSYPEKCGERMDPLPPCGGGLSGPLGSLGAHKPPSSPSHAARFSSLLHHPSPRLGTEALNVFSFSIYIHVVARSWFVC